MTPEQHAAAVERLAQRLRTHIETDGLVVAPDDAVAALYALVALAERADTLERERDEAQREADWQMGAKLAAQITLKAVTDALCLPLVSLGNGWTEATPKILARIETIVDEAERGFTERDQARAEADRLREALRYYADPGSWDEDGRAWPGDYWGEDDEDRGRVARAALAGGS